MKIENSEGNFEDKSNSKYDLTELENGAYPCLTDVFIDESNLPGAGKYSLHEVCSYDDIAFFIPVKTCIHIYTTQVEDSSQLETLPQGNLSQYRRY